MRLVHRLAELTHSGERAVLFTVVEGSGVGAKALVVEGGETLGDGVPEEALGQFDELVRRGRNTLLSVDGAKVFAEWYGPPPRVFVYGAVDTAEALCRGVKEILGDIARWRAKGEKVAIATVVATRRSAPRPVGAKLAVSESGELAGSVSGGCVESDVYECARRVLETGEPQLLSYGIKDEEAWEVGLPCGGEIDVFVERLEE